MTDPHPASELPKMIHPAYLLRRFWFVPVLLGVLALAGANWFWNAFHDRGYAPQQPIAFSHKQHAGDLKIDCQYCHSNASRGKHAGIPAMSVCLGCHNNVGGDKPEVQKLLAVAEKGSYEDGGVIHEGGVVHWKRVHRLPDHVYFSHQWHVAAGVSCKTCHGPVDTYVTMRQHSDLTMGWCLECHRRSNYVGGPRQQAGDPSSFTVGTANNAAMLKQEERDPVVEFHGRPASASHAATESLQQRLQRLIEGTPAFKGLPTWRIADLPASHRELYGSEQFMNAPTQCSTCHQ